jgi:hypothetical protein
MSAAMVDDFAFALNAMVKRWNATGLHVWTTTEATLFPQAGQIKYRLGTGSTDHVTELYYETAISAVELSGQTTISLDDTTNITALDQIGIVLDSGALHWTTVVSKTATDVLIALALTDDAAEGNAVFTYTDDIVRPLKIVDARRYDIDSATDTPISVVARLEYQGLPLKTDVGNINQIFYDAQLSFGFIYIWHVPNTTTELLKFTWHRPIMDFNFAGDSPDLPQEWIQTIQFNLAAVMLAQFPVAPQRMDLILSQAETFLNDLTGFDRENESLFFQPNWDGR